MCLPTPGVPGGIRTLTIAQQVLSLPRLPVPPLGHVALAQGYDDPTEPFK